MDKSIEALLIKHTYEPGKKIGAGTQGAIYELVNHPNKVLKLTSDENEAFASQIVSRYNLKNVVKIYKVYFLKSTDLYIVIMEKLNKISKKDEDNWYFFFEIMNKLSYIPNKETEKVTETTQIAKFKNSEEWAIFALETLKKYSKKTSAGKRSFETIYTIVTEHLLDSKLLNDVFEGLKEIGQLGINYMDFHEQNIMIDSSGNFKIIDLGYSISPLAKINILEKRNNE